MTPIITRTSPLKVMTALRIISSVEICWPTGRGRSNGFTLLSDAREILIYVPPTASLMFMYSISGSIIIISMPNMRLRNTSNFTAYDFPAPDVANTTIFAFWRENRSKIIRLLLCRLMPHIIPVSLDNSEEINGKELATGDEFMLNDTTQ